MSTSTYRLADRGRPPPLRLNRSSFNDNGSTRSSGDLDRPAPLYDLPMAGAPDLYASKPLLHSPVQTPTSPTPTYAARRVSNTPIRPGSRRTTPPPRPPTPSQTVIPGKELEEFAANCRAMYYQQDDRAGRDVSERLQTSRPSERAQFAKLQASIRTAFHRDTSARKKAEFQAHLLTTHPGCSLSPAARANPSRHRVERRERFHTFVNKWCTQTLIGTTPFFVSLWAISRLQILPVELGGAGGRRIEWQLDDAVFRESAGQIFMVDAIDMLKGVLAFEEVLLRKPPELLITAPMKHGLEDYTPPQNPTAHFGAEASRIMRVPSDPFLDTSGVTNSALSDLSTRLPTETAVLTTSAGVQLSAVTLDREIDALFQQVATENPIGTEVSFIPRSHPIEGDTEDDDDMSTRVWIMPDLTNPDLGALLAAFPPFITRRTLPRFSTGAHSRRAIPDPEAGDNSAREAEVLRCGTGTFWIGDKPRSRDYGGSWWQNFVAWLRRLFC